MTKLSKANVLIRIIKKAVLNGFNIKKQWGYDEWFWEKKTEAEKLLLCERLITKDYIDYRSIIFNLEFAKAFFGEGMIADCGLKLMPKEFEAKYKKARADWADTTYMWQQIEDKYPEYCYNQDDPECACSTEQAYRYHLTVAVLQAEPLLYMEKFL